MQRTVESGRKVVVTGAAGLLGRAVVAACQEQGWETYALARGPAPTGAAHSIRADLSAPDADLLKLLPDMPDAIVHLAAAVPHAAEFPDTVETARLTRCMDRCVHAAALAWDIPVIYASSCGLYDRLDPSWKTESTAVQAVSPYFAAKLDGEALFRTLPRATVMRLSALYGPGLRANLVMARFVTQARMGEPITVWGSGRREQDFIHATDVAAFVLAALKSVNFGIYNVAAGQPTAMGDLAAIVAAYFGGRVVSAERPDPLDHETARYDIAKAAERLDWSPAIGLSGGIAMLADEVFA